MADKLQVLVLNPIAKVGLERLPADRFKVVKETRAPDVILEVRAVGLLEPRDLEADRQVWSALASVPAVRNGRNRFLVGEYLVVPGPRVAQGIDAIARALHPESYK